MKASDVLGRPVRGRDGTTLGIVHDLRVRLPSQDAGVGGPRGNEGVARLEPVVVALVVGPDDVRTRVAHAWGFAQGRSWRPAVVRALLAGRVSRTQRIAADQVMSWDQDGHVIVTEAGP